ncbi:MAG TPA: SH3 domain-containing protein [Pseudolabrys sp.]|nr:SH3 domain-containing protein [Pseudolabrys sp.]
MQYSRPLLCAGALFLMSATGASAATAYALTTVNLRSGPGTTNEILGRIPGGSRIDAMDCKDGWCAVTWNGKSGFAIQTALDTSGRLPVRRAPRAYYGDEEVYAGPPVYYAPPPAYYYGPPAYYYGPYGGWGWHRHWHRW